MVTTEINYEGIFKMFCKKTGYRREIMQPFTQNGKYYATDEISAISMPIGGEMKLQEQAKPMIESVIPKELHEPIEIDVAKFKEAIIKYAPLVDEMKEEEHECRNCDGEGTQECNLGHDHDCEECNGNGIIESKNPTGNKIPDKKTVFFFMEAAMNFTELMRLIKASELLGVEKIYKIAGSDKKPFYFRVGKANILVMPCYNSDRDKSELVVLPIGL